jgi:hypothetical protein
MPAKSQAQRAYLNAKFGHAWVKKHGFDNPGKLPAHVGKKGKTMARSSKGKGPNKGLYRYPTTTPGPGRPSAPDGSSKVSSSEGTADVTQVGTSKQKGPTGKMKAGMRMRKKGRKGSTHGASGKIGAHHTGKHSTKSGGSTHFSYQSTKGGY